MKKIFKYFFVVVLPVCGLAFLFGSCASTPSCNNDACYERNVSSVDPYKKGNIATWGSEKEVADQDEEKEMRIKEYRQRNDKN